MTEDSSTTVDTGLPGKARLLRSWMLLILLTAVSMITAQLDSDSGWQALPLWGAVLVLLSTGFKVQQVLMVYLNLRISSAGWKGAFIGLLIATLGIIFAGYLVARFSA